MRERHQWSLGPLLALVVLFAACGSDNGSPVAPGEVPGPGGSSGATITGTVSAGAVSAVRTAGAGLAGFKVVVSGTDLTATTGSGGSFTIEGVPPGHVTLEFRGSGVTGGLELESVGAGERIVLTVLVSGSGTIELAGQQRVTGQQAQLEGKIASLDRPARTFVIGGTTVLVPEGIPITKGFRALDYNDLVTGARVHVKGTYEGDTLVASRILVQQTALDSVKMTGAISAVTGPCPDATFELNGVLVNVNASTIYVQGSCAALVDGQTVEIKGLRREDGTVLATMVKFKKSSGDDDDDDGSGTQTIEVTGVISGLRGPCPAVKFQLDGRLIHTTGATAFSIPCGSLADGQTVTVVGKLTGSGMVIASRVSAG